MASSPYCHGSVALSQEYFCPGAEPRAGAGWWKMPGAFHPGVSQAPYHRYQAGSGFYITPKLKYLEKACRHVDFIETPIKKTGSLEEAVLCIRTRPDPKLFPS